MRQTERRIKQWAGLPMRELKGISRAEQAFFESLAVAEAGGTPQWSAVAQSNGYADQSHLCRDTRRITGFAPQELYQRIANDEAFWVYRIWQ
jgi:AraC-like DNA-binding protein